MTMTTINPEPVTDERAGLPSASRMERVIACPGSIAAEQGLTPLPEEDVTTEGTEIHTAMETGDARGLEENAQQIAVRLERMVTEARTRWEAANETVVGLDEKEVRVWIRGRQLEPVASAKLDRLYINVGATHALIIDYKTGYRAVTPAERNWQLLTQAVAVLDDYPSVEHFEVGYAQSRLSSKLDTAVYTADQIRHAKGIILGALWLSEQPGAHRNAGTWCHYCQARGECPTAATYATVVLADPAMRDKLGMIDAIGNLTIAQQARVWRISKVAQRVFDAIEDRLKNTPEAALEPNGIKLKPGATTRAISDYGAARAKLAGLLTEPELNECSKFTLGSILKFAKQGRTAKAAETLVESTLGELIVTKENKPSLTEI